MTAALLDPTAGDVAGGGSSITAAALSQLGKPYGWAQPVSLSNPDPKAFDCSGLVVWSIYQATGKALIHQSAALYASMPKRPYAQAQPGDVVFFGSPLVHHCGIYLGGGQMVEAPDFGIPVRISAVASNPATLRSSVGYVAGSSSSSSTSPAAVPGLSPDQAANAGIIAQVGAQMGASARDIAVAIMTALDESGLRNLSGGDRDSAGLFQQRPSQGWGSWAQVTTPTYAASSFFQRLLAIPNRDTQNPWMEAQDVQNSADPTGSNYQQFWPQAQSITGAVTGADRLGITGTGSGLQGATQGFNWGWLGGVLSTGAGSVAGGVASDVERFALSALFVVGGIVLVLLGAKNAASARPSTNVVVGS